MPEISKKGKSHSSIISILVPDAENGFLFNILSCFAQVDNVLIYAMTNKKTLFKYSRYVKNCSVYPATDDVLERIANINAEVAKHGIDIIMPAYDSCVKDLIIYRKHVVHPEKIILLPSAQAHKIATNKGLLGLHLEKNAIPAPKTFIVKRDSFLGYAKFKLNFPFIIKPSTNSSGGLGVVLINTHEALQKYMCKYEDFDEFVVQEYFEGEDWGCSVVCLKGSIKAYTVQKTTMHERNKFSPAIGIALIQDHRPIDMVSKLIKTLEWSGIAHIDMRYNPKNGQFVIIEMNARYWASLAASTFGGINFPYTHTLLSLGKEVHLQPYRTIEYLKLKGVQYKLRRNVLFLLRFKFLRSNTEIRSMLKDPLPSIFRIFSYTQRFIKSRFYNIPMNP